MRYTPKPAARQARPPLLALPGFLVGLLVLSGCEAAPQDTGAHRFASTYEPSGIQQLPDGRFVVVEDEATHSLDVVTLRSDGTVAELPLYRASLFSWASNNRILGTLEDLEGVAVDDDGFVYVVTSHSRKANGRRIAEREQLVRFRITGDQIADAQVVDNLRKALVRTEDSLRKAGKVKDVKDDDEGLNIEALSFDPGKQKLLIGLRGPMAGKDAIVLVLENPRGVFEGGEEPRLDDRLIELDLDDGGIRGMAYDPHLGGYLIISRKPGKSFKFWLWSGDPSAKPRRIRADDLDGLDQPEGITPVVRDGRPAGILLVSDDGLGAAGKPGHYLFLPYEQLQIEDP